MSSFLRKLSPTAINKRLPKSVQKVIVKTAPINPALSHAIAVDEATQGQFKRAAGGSSFKVHNAAYQRFFDRTFLPGSTMGKEVVKSDTAIYTGTPVEKQQAIANLDQLYQMTDKHALRAGKVFSVVGGVTGLVTKAATAVGTVQNANDNLSRLKEAEAGVARGNRSILDGPAGFNGQAEGLPESYANRPPASMAQPATAARPGVVASIVDFLFGLFVGHTPHVDNQSQVSGATMRVPTPANLPAPADAPNAAGYVQGGL